MSIKTGSDDGFVVDQRKSKILKTVVDTYIDDPTPVASKVVHKKTRLDVSPATIRNEMHTLEDAGYLMHPHTSSGRIPTDLGYRFFVDNFVPSNSNNQHAGEMSLDILDKSFQDSEINSVDRLLEQTVILLSSLTQYTALIVKESLGKSKVCDLHISIIDSDRCVVALFFDDSTIQRIPIDNDQLILRGFSLGDLNDELLRRETSNQLLELLSGKSVHEFSSNNIGAKRLRGITRALLDIVISSRESESAAGAHDATVRVAGVANIAKASSSDPNGRGEISSQLLSLIEQHMTVIDLIRNSADETIAARIGSENVYSELSKHSLVLAPFSCKDGEKGTVGIIGPTRMNYSKVFNILNSASNSVAKFLDQQ